MTNQILLVDDDVDLLDTFEECLTIRGYEIITAKNGEEAILQYKEKKPYITFMDIQMPKMDGYEVFSKIKEIDNDAKIIFVTGNGTSYKTQIARQNGLLRIIKKPADMREIVKVIEENKCQISFLKKTSK